MHMDVGKYVRYLSKVGGFSQVLLVSSASNTDRHHKTSDVESGIKPQSIQSNPIGLGVTFNI